MKKFLPFLVLAMSLSACAPADLTDQEHVATPPEAEALQSPEGLQISSSLRDTLYNVVERQGHPALRITREFSFTPARDGRLWVNQGALVQYGGCRTGEMPGWEAELDRLPPEGGREAIALGFATAVQAGEAYRVKVTLLNPGACSRVTLKFSAMFD
jgi:hypothetical protein